MGKERWISNAGFIVTPSGSRHPVNAGDHVSIFVNKRGQAEGMSTSSWGVVGAVERFRLSVREPSPQARYLMTLKVTSDEAWRAIQRAKMPWWKRWVDDLKSLWKRVWL